MARHAPESVSAYIFKRTCAGRQQRECIMNGLFDDLEKNE